MFVPRLSAVKFPASWRRDVYRTHPHHEQEHWLARIDAEPDLESTLLAECVVAEEMPRNITYRELLRMFIGQTAGRIRRRFATRSRKPIAKIRRFKGL